MNFLFIEYIVWIPTNQKVTPPLSFYNKFYKHVISDGNMLY